MNQSPLATPAKPILTNHTSQSTHLTTPPLPPPPPKVISAGYGTDNDSIKTEDFENRFQSLIVMTDGNTSGESGLKSTTSRNKRWKNSNGNGEVTARGKGGFGNGHGAGSKSPSHGSAKAINGTGGGKVSFDDTSRDAGNAREV